MEKIGDVFFDLDRTLWDFEKNSEVALRILYEEYKLADYVSDEAEFIKKYKEVNSFYWKSYAEGKITKREMRIGRFGDTVSHFGVKSDEIGAQMHDRYIEISPYQTNLFPSTKEVLTELKDKDYRLHIITNGFLEVQHLKLKHSGIAHFFDSVLCSEEVGVNKPDPKVFQEAMSRAKTKAESAIMIGDDFNADIIGAENVGMRGLLFDPYQHYKNAVSVDRIDALSEIPDWILR